MHRYYILAIFAIFLNFSAAKADHLRDSIGVENLKGKKIILHQVIAKDTYYSISRRYNVSPKVIMTFNNDKYLSLGVIIKVPTDIPFSEPRAVKSGTASKMSPETKTSAPASTTLAVGKPAAATEENTTLIEHSVQRKENLNIIAKKYGTTVDEIKRVNNLRSINLQIGQVLKIPAKEGTATDETTGTVAQAPAAPVTTAQAATAPIAKAPANTGAGNTGPVTTNPAGTTTPPVTTAAVPVQGQYKKPDTSKKTETVVNKAVPVQLPKQEAPVSKDQLVVHTVAGNETMYSIATKYSLTLDQLKAKNNLSTNSLYVGQKLLISGQYPVNGEHTTDPASLSSDTAESVKNPSLRLPPSRYGLSQMDEKGTGVWIMDPDLDSSKMLVLHRSAPVGTIMKITNPMSNRSTFAKVVGKFTENESTKDVIIVMTKAVADALGALDKRFLCNLTYSGQANEQ
ncbi:LysM peptidoglycan-binding domain-containing protein [Pedobacter hartonius]|uniref:LysM repeat-containing protein n=1 Tax=Pedobacter hartonius TaxID=425514 RepID=A0A1H4CJS7_9SPHI|nr:LysM peptidoglycan-binding domain-containing protein [Pedobacter hartonius]SEA60696.1 LysM repeat-containing protein [Pedobacter hartonius]